MAEFYFVDTREGAKTSEPFAIHNADVAKIWSRDYNTGEGPFKPVESVEYTVNRRDLKAIGEITPEAQEAATEKNAQFDGDNPYQDMDKKDLQDELEARGIEFKAKATKADLIELLIADDAQ
jgi:hypothetical protein